MDDRCDAKYIGKTRNIYDVLVVGAGQAGLAAGYHLKQAGLSFLLLEAGRQSAGSWPRYYDSLTLFSPARHSSLPGLAFPGDPERYPKRDEVSAYLNRYRSHFRLPVVFEARVTDVRQSEAKEFEVQTAAGELYHARGLIIATGPFNAPNMPAIPGETVFAGRRLHAIDYRAPQAFRGQQVVVVGAGNTAVQIAVELADVAQVTLATRKPVRFAPQRLFGHDIHDWLGRLKLDTLPLGERFRQSEPVLDPGVYRTALRRGSPKRRAMFERFTPEGVLWPDGQTEAVDTVIFATGYRPNLDFLVGTGALDEKGRPLHHYGVSATVPNLYYLGLPWQRSHASATLRGVGEDARRVVRHVLEHGSERKSLLRLSPCC